MDAQNNKTNKQVNGNGDDAQVHLNNRKRRLKWTIGLHECFLQAVHQLGGSYKATPKQIQKLMDVQEVNSDHIKSHLQKHRLRIDQCRRAKTKAARKAINIFSWMPEGNEDTYMRSTLTARHTDEDIQNIKAQRPAFEGSAKFNVESKNSGHVVQPQLGLGAHKTHLLLRSDTEARYDNGVSASNYKMHISGTNFIMSLAETKEKHMSLYSSSGDANADKATAEKKTCDGLIISSGSFFSKGGSKTRIEDRIDIPRMTPSNCQLPFDLNVSAQDVEPG